MEPWNEDRDFNLKMWAERGAKEALESTYFSRFRTESAPRPCRRRLYGKTWRLREALRGLRMGWRGEI